MGTGEPGYEQRPPGLVWHPRGLDLLCDHFGKHFTFTGGKWLSFGFNRNGYEHKQPISDHTRGNCSSGIPDFHANKHAYSNGYLNNTTSQKLSTSSGVGAD
jgi:hypothetical protein